MVLSTKERKRLLQLIILEYLPANVRSEYQSMSSTSAKVLRDALDSMITQHVVHCYHERALSPIELPQMTTASDSCPLSQLVMRDSSVPLFVGIPEEIKQRLRLWGYELPQFMMSFKIQEFESQAADAYAKLLSCEVGEFSQSTVIATKTGSPVFRWESLREMSVRDLKLFESCKGSVLRGTLVTSPLMMTGATTFLQDHHGDIIQLGLYNFVPGKMSRLDRFEYVRKHLRKGTRVAIAEPFLKILVKIFYDGGRGVRVDDPRELQLGADDTAILSISSYREEGNAFYKKKMHLAAIEEHRRGCQKVGGSVEVRRQHCIQTWKLRRGHQLLHPRTTCLRQGR